MKRGRFTALVFAAAFLAAGLTGALASKAVADEAEQVDASTCANCHEDQVAAFAKNPHSVLDTEGLASKAGAPFSCAACHGDSAKHIDEGGGTGSIFAFGGTEQPRVKTQRCLACHADVHPNFLQGPHGRGGVACTDCHSIHSSDPATQTLLQPAKAGALIVGRPGTSALCAGCHEDVAARFGLNEHHRLQEGIIECTSCHNPHDVQVRRMLGGFKQDECATCHADKTGPYIYEHGSVKVAGCTACHDPHGSVNRHQLNFQKEAELCFSCHAAIPSFHSRFSVETNCTNCHTAIHGSNFQPYFLQ